jgi:diguanylate cyclase (GGDEF)-like protein
LKVLLLEDDPGSSELLSLALGQIDRRYDFLYAARLSEALALLDAQEVDIALIDLGLPDATDTEAALSLRSQFPHIPIVALTGHRFDDLAVTLTRNGIQDFLRKGDASAQRVHEVLQLAIERHRQDEALRRQAMHDVLTGVLNRAHLEEQLRKAADRAARQGMVGAVLSIDVDDFKTVNDRFGHHAGDAVLIELSSRLTQTLRRGDNVYRVGGDEFIVVAEGLRAATEAEAIAAHVRHAVHFQMEVQGHPIAVSASIGVSLFPDQSDDPTTLLRLCDDAMYSVKRAGKGGFAIAGGGVIRGAVSGGSASGETVKSGPVADGTLAAGGC